MPNDTRADRQPVFFGNVSQSPASHRSASIFLESLDMTSKAKRSSCRSSSSPPNRVKKWTRLRRDNHGGSLRRFNFEKLPPEVRSIIYSHLLAKDHTLRPLCREDRYFEEPGTARPLGLGDAVPLLQTSRLINAEASLTLYGKNTFLLYGLDFGDSALAFLKAIGKRNRRTIRSLQLDWQHGIIKINQASRATDLFAMVSDRKNPLREYVARMLHEVGRTTIDKFVATLSLMVDSPRLEHLAIICPGTDSPGHPDNHTADTRVCSGCRHEVQWVLRKIQGLKSLTVGDTDGHNELERLATEMGVQELNITQVDSVQLSAKSAASFEKDGWRLRVTWEDPDGNDIRRVATKRLQRTEVAGCEDPKSWW